MIVLANQCETCLHVVGDGQTYHCETDQPPFPSATGCACYIPRRADPGPWQPDTNTDWPWPAT